MAVRVGIIGCGGVTVQRHLPALARAKNARVAALCDTDESRLRSAATRFQIPRTFSAAAELIHSSEVDAVAVCVPTAAHADLACTVVKAGKHLYLEKPIAATACDAQRIVAASEASTTVSMMGFNLRSHRLLREAALLLSEGKIGDVQMMRSVYTSCTRMSQDAPAWRLDPVVGGILQEQAIHHFDLWRCLLKSEIEEIDVRLNARASEAVATARTQSGVLIQASFSEATIETNELEIFGTNGALRLSFYEFDGLEIIPKGMQVGGLRRRLQRALQSLAMLPRTVIALRDGGEYVASYRQRWEHFADCVGARDKVNGTLEDGLKALQLVLAARESASQLRPVRLS